MIPLLIWMWTSLLPKIKRAFPALIDRIFPKMSVEERTQFDPNAMSCPLAAILPGRPFNDEDLIEPEPEPEPDVTADTPQTVHIKED